MFQNAKPSELLSVLATVDPSAQAAGAVVTTFVSVKNHHTLMALIQVGAFGASATVDAKLRQATDAAGTGVKDIAGKAIVQMLAAGGNNKQVLINMKTGDLDTEGGFAFVALSLTVGVAATQTSAVLLATNPRFADAATFNQAGVTQVI
jgi:hypothetical protein